VEGAKIQRAKLNNPLNPEDIQHDSLAMSPWLWLWCLPALVTVGEVVDECLDPLLDADTLAPVILTATVGGFLGRESFSEFATYSVRLRVRKVYLGNPAIENKEVVVSGLNDPTLCQSGVRLGDTKIFLLEQAGRQQAQGIRNESANSERRPRSAGWIPVFRLHSSIISINLKRLKVLWKLDNNQKRVKSLHACPACRHGAVCRRGVCQCPLSCPSGHRPVCDQNGKAYETSCILDLAACRQQRHLVATPCPQKPLRCPSGSWPGGQSCMPCLCSRTGARGTACDQGTGQCFCKPGWVGHECSVCPGGSNSRGQCQQVRNQMMADSSQKLPWIVASRESQNAPQPQILPLIAVERPDPAQKWLNAKLREKKEKWNRKRRRRKKKRKRKGRKRRMWEEEAIGFAGNSTSASASFPFKSLTTTNIELRFRSWNPDGVLMESRGGAGDFLILSLVRGKLELRWELGSGPGMLAVGETAREGRTMSTGGNLGGMGLGRWHRVKVKRYHRDVQLTVDRELVVIGRSKGSHKSLNVEPVVRLGSNLFGCIGGLKVDGRQIELEGRQKCRGCKACRSPSRSSTRPSTSSMRRKNSWPSFMLNNNV